MNITDSQREMRVTFLGGFAGQLVSGLIWLLATGISYWYRPGYGMAMLFFGSMLIFPLTQGTLNLMGRLSKVSTENKLWWLGSQIAFTVPIYFLLVGAATLYREDWFFPAVMIVVGAHYLPFVTLYGMKMYAFLAVLLVCTGLSLAIYVPGNFNLGCWITAIILILFAFIGRQIALQEHL